LFLSSCITLFLLDKYSDYSNVVTVTLKPRLHPEEAKDKIESEENRQGRQREMKKKETGKCLE